MLRPTILLTTVFSLTLAAAPIYQVTPLSFNAIDMNNRGDVIGGATSAGVTTFLLYDFASATYSDRSNLGGYATRPTAVNDQRSIAGTVNTGSASQAFYYDFTGYVRLLDPLPGDISGQSLGLNNSGQLLGSSYGSPSGSNTWLWNIHGSTLPQAIGVPGMSALDLNDSQTVVGWSLNRPFLLEGGTFTALGFLNPGDTFAALSAINNTGVAVGYSYSAITAQSFLYRSGAMTPLPQMPGGVPTLASDINDAGVIIGEYFSAAGIRQFVLVDGVIYDINELIDPAWTGGDIVGTSIGINNAGQIVINSNSGNLAWLLTPTSGSSGGGGGASEVPEPASAALMALAALASAGWRLRHTMGK